MTRVNDIVQLNKEKLKSNDTDILPNLHHDVGPDASLDLYASLWSQHTPVRVT